MGPGEQAIDADRNRRRAMSTEATPQTTVRALVFTSLAHYLVAVRGTLSPTASSSEPPRVDRYCAGHPIALKTATGSR